MGVIVGLDGQPLYRSESYEGATSGRRAYGWSAPSMGPNRALAYAGKPLRNRTRAGYRNSLLMRSGINKNTTNEVGKGFTLISTSKSDEFKKAFNPLWKIISQQLDPWGDLNFGGIVKLAVLSRRMSGEVFIRRLRRRLSSGLEVPLQVEVLESDLCPLDLNKRISARRRIVQGIEFDGKVKVAYWFYKSHPDDGLDSVSINKLERVPARDIIHHYMPTRPGQVRAEPETAAALLKDRTFHEYDDSELVRKRQRSSFTGFLYREDVGEDEWEFDPYTGQPKFDDSQVAAASETVNAGTIIRGVRGEKLSLFDGDNTGQGYADYVRWQSIMMSAGMEIPYPLMTGDWSDLNDRLVRAILNEYRRGISFDQNNLSGFQVAFGIWRWAIETVITTGQINAPGYALDPWLYYDVDIRPDAWKHLHPEQDINARNKAVASNISNAERESADYGADLEDNMRRNAKALKRWKKILEEEGIEEPANLGGLFSACESMGEP
ncbi:phage portal protein [Pseudoalteromonas sp. Of7M-16]|uniref:phage portal protein n=1 Tax=Pseudoalteromonas sp. Of7M-16 TaxID=2917756 RepID=UPI001EF657A9|nr:phage portal protein [Pseudoalteromonas sp. Of7M-16]MCG7551562.1 phage portal protein [Pseudoalteromonas sp. Of7M-16]